MKRGFSRITTIEYLHPKSDLRNRRLEVRIIWGVLSGNAVISRSNRPQSSWTHRGSESSLRWFGDRQRARPPASASASEHGTGDNDGQSKRVVGPTTSRLVCWDQSAILRRYPIPRSRDAPSAFWIKCRLLTGRTGGR